MLKFGMCKDENIKFMKFNEILIRERDSLKFDRNIFK